MDLCIDLTGLSTTARMRSEGRHGNVLSETGNNHQRLRVCFFTLFVHTLSFSATTVFNIETVQMHNSTTDTIKDTYYVFRSIQQILTICMFDFFICFISLNINMFVLHPASGSSLEPLTQSRVWKLNGKSFFPKCGRRCGRVEQQGAVSVSPTVIIWVGRSNQLHSYLRGTRRPGW